MSESMGLICIRHKQIVWIGQIGGGRHTLYSNEKDTMELLRRFLDTHQELHCTLTYKPTQDFEDMAKIEATDDRKIVARNYTDDPSIDAIVTIGHMDSEHEGIYAKAEAFIAFKSERTANKASEGTPQPVLIVPDTEENRRKLRMEEV